MIDTHCHLSIEDYPDIDEVIKKMNKNIIIVSGINDDENRQVVNLVNKYPNVYGTIGIHPTETDKISDNSFEYIEKNLINPKIVGIGEIGLDYHYECDRERQKEIFIKQIEMANKYNKTIVIHSRDAANDTLEVLKKYKNSNIKANIHCFSNGAEMAQEFIKLNCKLGVGGVITFKNNRVLKEVVESVDLKYLLLETDSPFLTPEPFRGARNEPYNIIYVAEKIAEIKGIDLTIVLSETTKNALYQFDLNLNL